MSTRIPPARISGLYGAVVKRFSKKMLGRVPEPLAVYWHNPAVLKTYLSISGSSRKWEACDPNLKSFAHLAVAAKVGCSWCLDFGYFEAENRHLDLEKARQVPRWRESELFTPLERDVLAYAEAMTESPPTVTDELSTRLREKLGAPALVELTALVALANFYTRSNVAMGIESEGFSTSCALRPLVAPARPGVASPA